MPGSKHSTDAQLLARASRLAPSDAERFAAWFRSLGAKQRADALDPLLAVLSGLVAFRHLENHSLPVASTGLRAHLRTVHASYRWALELVGALLEAGSANGQGPKASLLALQHSLSDALRVSERLVELPSVHAEDFIASFDLFLRDLRHNPFFAPPDPLELTHPGELRIPAELAPELEELSSEAAKMTTTVTLLSLLRAHRFLGIADRYIGSPDGVHRAQIIVSAVRRELRTLTRFLLVQGVDSLTDDYVTRTATDSSKAVEAFRKSIERIAMDIHLQTRAMLDEGLPRLDADGRPSLDPSGFHRTAATARRTLKECAKRLRWLGAGPRSDAPDRPEDIRSLLSLREELWAFRFVLWAFADKAWAASQAQQADFSFVDAFERLWEGQGPRLATVTEYPHQGPLLQSVDALRSEPGSEPKRLRRAREECLRFCAHLNASFALLMAEPSLSQLVFDRNAAAERLRRRLAGARRSPGHRAAAGAFGLLDRDPGAGRTQVA